MVTIRTISSSRSDDEADGDWSDPFGGLWGEDEGGDEIVRESLGSGVIIDASGIVMTNYHVVRQKGQMIVELHDGRQFEIAATKADPHTDLAVLQLKNAAGMPFAQLGDSDALKVGDWVLAVGSQFGLEATVTAGIISAKGRGLAHLQATTSQLQSALRSNMIGTQHSLTVLRQGKPRTTQVTIAEQPPEPTERAGTGE